MLTVFGQEMQWHTPSHCSKSIIQDWLNGLTKSLEYGTWTYLDTVFWLPHQNMAFVHTRKSSTTIWGVMSKLTLQVNEVKVINRNCASPILSDYNGQLPNHLSDRLKQQKNIVVQAALHYTFKITSIVQLLVVSRKVHSILTQQSLNWTKLFETSGSRSKF